MNPQYVYEVVTRRVLGRSEQAMFVWPNGARKYIRDTYTTDGELHLPPGEHLVVKRHKLNPKAGGTIVIDCLDIGKFLEA